MENHKLKLDDMLDKKHKITENNLDLEIAIPCWVDAKNLFQIISGFSQYTFIFVLMENFSVLNDNLPTLFDRKTGVVWEKLETIHKAKAFLGQEKLYMYMWWRTSQCENI